MINRIEDLLIARGHSKFIGMSEADIAKNYRVYFIKKKSGKKREICAPNDELGLVQRTICSIIKDLVTPHKSTAGFEKGCSIVLNAKRHRQAKHILHLDLKNFFPSISRKMFDAVYGAKLNSAECATLWTICSYKGGLPIGAPSSPFIANRIMKPVDIKLNALSPFVKYSRYADDLVFSSFFRISDSFVAKITNIVSNYYTLCINREKTQFASSRKIVTGINITNDKRLTLGTAYKKRLKSNIYQLLMYNNGSKAKVKGEFSFLAMVEPSYAKVIKEKYNPLDRINFFS